MAKEAYYFPHDSNARNDDKILELRAEFGWEAYGLYWAIIEILRDASNYNYSSNATAGLALSLNYPKDELQQFLKRCFDLNLFLEQDGFFYSESLMKRMEGIDEKRRRRAEAGRIGGFAKAKIQQSPGIATAKVSKEKKVKKSINTPMSEENTHGNDFDLFWDAFGKKVGKKKCQDLWAKLPKVTKAKIMEVLPTYLKNTPDTQFRKNPLTWLQGEHWQDDLTPSPNSTSLNPSPFKMVM